MTSAPLLFDTHLHINGNDDVEEIFGTSRAAGVGYFLIAGTNLQDSITQQRFAATQPDVFSSVGIHPHSATSFDGNIETFRELLHQERVAAVGEIGLDYHYDFSPRKKQRDVFEAFFTLAAEEKKAVVIHCREAYEDCMAVVRANLRSGQAFEFHSFSGTPEQAEEILALGGFLAFNGMVTFDKADNIRDSLAVVPLEQLLLETDSPYLAPVPYRGKPNKPAYVIEVARKIASLRKCSLKKIIEQTTANGKRFFSIDS